MNSIDADANALLRQASLRRQTELRQARCAIDGALSRDRGRLHALSATIVLIENDGGGIFSFLPQATTDAPEVGLPDHYEELFGTPHGIDVGPIVTALGGEYRSVGPAELREALTAPFPGPGVRVLGFRTDRRRNVELHREAAAAVADALPRS